MTAAFVAGVARARNVAAAHGVPAEHLQEHLDGIRDARARLRAATGVAVDAVLLHRAGRDVTALPRTRVAFWTGLPTETHPVVLWTPPDQWRWRFIDGIELSRVDLAAILEPTVIPVHDHPANAAIYPYAPVELRHAPGPHIVVERLTLTTHAAAVMATAAA
ncbi:hypothetical protein [Georgenia yuyongxinii]|uniref:Uncharacterized protein n=1 Tax=Georgenia yuyongxinii TaxID=2589797 RepID=A0A552WU83_9MICO|nr:hypothetical protein [Georgenia yuyongxinii]TRW46408.1 hypothetical protein FJ693_05635 [Georgenia yuyongxinii]